MGPLWKWFSLRSRSLRREMAIVIGIVLLVTLVFVGYLFPGVSSIFQIRTHLSIVLWIVMFILVLAFIVLAEMIEPVIKISSEAKKIADGDLDRKIQLARQDEIGELGQALNRMTMRIKENMEELKSFSEKTEAINTEINKRILALSSLLQISNLVSQNANLEEIKRIGIEKCLSTGEMNFACLVLKDKHNEYAIDGMGGPKSKELAGLEKFPIKLGEGLLGKAILRQEEMIIDRDSKKTSDIEQFRSSFKIKNALIVPVLSSGKMHGLLVTGNDKDNFVFSTTERELTDLLSKQIAIAIENYILTAKVEKLEIIDNLTGLFNSTYISERLSEEIKRAIRFQRPCAFVIFSVDHFKDYLEAFGYLAAENALIKIGSVLKENISDVDKAGRFGDHEFAIILPEKNKRQAIEIADNIRRKIEFVFSEEEDTLKKLTCTGSVTENPVDGMTADELIVKAKNILESTQKQGLNRIFYKI